MKHSHHTILDQHALVKLQKRTPADTLPDNPIYREITRRLLERLDIIRVAPKTILNLGLHSKNAETQLQERYPSATILSTHSLNAITNQSFDLVIMHFSLLHAQEPLQLLYAILCRLRPEGLLLFTSLGPDTFLELRQSFSQVDHYPHVHTFTDMHDIGDWMKQLNFSDPVVDREEIIAAYDNLNLFFEDLKTYGTTNLSQTRLRGLFSKNKWRQMLLHYSHYKKEDYFPVTLEIIYGHGWKVAQQTEAQFPQEIIIPLDNIRFK